MIEVTFVLPMIGRLFDDSTVLITKKSENMKTIKGFLRSLRSTPIYTGSFANREDVFSQFSKAEDSDIVILYADYETPDYEGYATVIYYRKSTKQYYEAYGSHCSCYGLENQWESDEAIVPAELLKRIGSLQGEFEKYLAN